MRAALAALALSSLAFSSDAIGFRASTRTRQQVALRGIDDLLDEWVTLQEGCTFDNDFCDNATGVALARQDPTGPVLPKWMTCSARADAAPSTWVSVAAIWVLLALMVRVRRS